MLQDQFNAARQMQADEYTRDRDRINDWYNDLGIAKDDEKTAYERGNSSWYLENQLKTQDEQTAYDRQQDAYNKLTTLIVGTGYTPTEEELAAAGITKQQATALAKQYSNAHTASDRVVRDNDPEKTFKETENTKWFKAAVMTKGEFARRGSKATVNGTTYTDYQSYIEASLKKWTDNGIPGSDKTLSDDEVAYTETEVKQYDLQEAELRALVGKINDQEQQINALQTRQAEQAAAQAQQINELQTRQEAQSSIQSQGRSAKYSFTSPGWKRVLNIIRTSGGVVNFGIAQSYPLYMSQATGICFSGFVKYKNDTTTDKKPVLYQLYNNLFGENDAMQNPGRITAVRIGYPDPKQANYNNGTSDALTNPINCYLDVLVEFDKDTLKSKSVSFNLNYSGFADSHNCEAITDETNATDVGIYGEKLLYHTLELHEGAGLYTPVGMADIQGYVKAGDGNNILSIPGLISGKSDYGSYGFMLNSKEENILVSQASTSDIDARSNKYKPIVPSNLDYAVQSVGDKRYVRSIDGTNPDENGNVSIDDKIEDIGDKRYVRSVEGKTPDKNGAIRVIYDSSIGTGAWSSRNIVDTLCPTLHYATTDELITCEPLEGYPLDVIVNFKGTPVSGAKNFVLNHTGKNMFNTTIPKDKAGMRFYRNSDGSFAIYGTPTTTTIFAMGTITLPAGTYTFGVGNLMSEPENEPEIYCRLIEPGATKSTVTWVGVNYAGRSFTLSKTTTLKADIIINNKGRYIRKWIYPQIEVGSVATKFETYRGKSYSLDLTNIPDNFKVYSYNFNTGLLEYSNPDTGSDEFIYLDQRIIRMSGINYLYATDNPGLLIVSGYSDPKALFEKLTNAIISLGGNV